MFVQEQKTLLTTPIYNLTSGITRENAESYKVLTFRHNPPPPIFVCLKYDIENFMCETEKQPRGAKVTILNEYLDFCVLFKCIFGFLVEN